MTTVIKVHLLSTIVEHRFQPHNSLNEAIATVMSEASQQINDLPAQPAAVLFSSSNLPVPNWQTRSVGASDILVIAAPSASISKQLADLQQRVTGLEVTAASMAVPRVRNLAASILLLILGEQRLRTTSTDYFKNFKDDRLTPMCQLFSASVDKVKDHADRVIERRNKAMHPGSIAELEEEVTEVQGIISRMAELRELCKWEVRFIQQFEELREIFADKFF